MIVNFFFFFVCALRRHHPNVTGNLSNTNSPYFAINGGYEKFLEYMKGNGSFQHPAFPIDVIMTTLNR